MFSVLSAPLREMCLVVLHERFFTGLSYTIAMRKIWILFALASALCAQPRQRPVYPAAKTGGEYMQSYYLPAAASTPWRPAWSPDGREIAFAMSGSIWKIRVGDTTAYELTANATYDSSPAWSPDGRWIAYTADDDAKSVNLRLLNVRTGESTSLTAGTQVNTDPAWSPDGKRLAYVSTAPNGWFNVYVMPFENGTAGAPIQITSDNRFGRARLYFSDNDLNIEPTWSPDGNELILLSNRTIPLGSGGVWRLPAEPDGMSKGRLILQEQTLFRTMPQWSPDGKRILYSSHRGAQFTNLYVLPAVGGEPYQMTFGEWDHFEPRWSPDGQWIVYVSNQHGLSDLRLLRTFGGDERLVDIRRRIYRRPMGTRAGDGARCFDQRRYARPFVRARVRRKNLRADGCVSARCAAHQRAFFPHGGQQHARSSRRALGTRSHQRLRILATQRNHRREARRGYQGRANALTHHQSQA